jgi:tetratricopeptide (TPR) repeat protein
MSRLGGWWASRSKAARSRWILGLVGLFALAAWVCGTMIRTEMRFQEALAAEKREEFVPARELLARCLRDDPGSGRFLFHAARVARREGDFGFATKVLKLANKQGWPTEAIEWEATLLNAQTIDFSASEQRFRLAIAAAPDLPETDLIREVMVQEYMRRYQMAEAYQVLEDWIRRSPNLLRPRLWMHEVARRLLIPQEAISSIRHAVTIAPNNSDARLKCGQILIENHQPLEAREHFDWLLARRPKDAIARFGLAKCLRELGDDDGAVRELTPILNVNPDRVEFLLERGLIDMAAGRPAAAKIWFRRAIDFDQSNIDLLYNYALCLEQSGESVEAAKWREQHKRVEADLTELKEVSKQFAAEPKNATLPHRAGVLMLRNGYEREAIRWFRRSLEIAPKQTESRKALNDYFEAVRKTAGPITLAGAK